MTVSELITSLATISPTATVGVKDLNSGSFLLVQDVEDGQSFSNETGPAYGDVVFLNIKIEKD